MLDPCLVLAPGLWAGADAATRPTQEAPIAERQQDRALSGLVDQAGGRLWIERLDITRPSEISALHERLDGARVDLLLVNAGITNGDVPVNKVSTGTFDEVMRTNGLGPMRVVEGLQEFVTADGAIAIMSSRHGSITLNDNAGHKLYRASKWALNQLMACYAARHRGESRPLLLVSPGWVQTELGGTAARLGIEDSVPGVIDTIAPRPSGGLLFNRRPAASVQGPHAGRDGEVVTPDVASGATTCT